VVAYGGNQGTTILDDTLVFKNGVWRRLDTVGSPGRRTTYAMAYDAARGEVVLFGGDHGDGESDNETWVLSGATWELKRPATSPPASRYGEMTYDPVRADIVLYTGSPVSETWTWDGEGWTYQPATGPPTDLCRFQMAWDASRREVVLQGGFNWEMGEPYFLGQTWAWNGTAWSRLEDGPTVAFHAMGSFGRHVVLFGGNQKGGAVVTDTWLLRRDGWVNLGLESHPPFQQFAQFVPHGRDRARLVEGASAPPWRLSRLG
jgi:hypothetical protein